MKKGRNRKSLAQKVQAIERYFDLETNGASMPKQTVTRELFGKHAWKTNKGYIGKRLNSVLKFRTKLIGALKNVRSMGRRRSAKYPNCEDELYTRLIARRTVYGYPCNHF
jgi:hypothetical protein